MDDKFDDIGESVKIAFEHPSEDCDVNSVAFSTIKKEEVQAILDARNRVTPMVVSELDSGEVFVFGSDVSGSHEGRASKLAMDEFGAVKGQGEGLFGRSYAIPTTDYKRGTWKFGRCNNISVSEEELKESVMRFLDVAKSHPELTFYVTRIGAGYAGFREDVVAGMFKPALKLKNVFLPQSFLNRYFNIKPLFANPSQMVPSTAASSKSFRHDLDVQLHMYQAWLRSHFEINPNDGSLTIMDCVERLCNGISMAVDLMYRGLPGKAYEALQSSLVQKRKARIIWKMKFSKINKDCSFYRMRVENDNWEKKRVDKNGMFHIPYSLRHIISTQRFSVPGYPSLYLAEHVYGCWEELGRPNLNNCLVSRFQNQSAFKVVDISIPDESIWSSGKSMSELKNMIILFPLIIACTFKTRTPKAAFKPEYIIPQLLLQYVKETAYVENKKKESDKRVIYGIKYTSVNISLNSEMNNSDSLTAEHFLNYVIPVIDIKNERCSRLCSTFKLTEPVCEEYELMEPENSSSQDEYFRSNLGKIEQVLKCREEKPILVQ